jgi:hypothetical protein
MIRLSAIIKKHGRARPYPNGVPGKIASLLPRFVPMVAAAGPG